MAALLAMLVYAITVYVDKTNNFTITTSSIPDNWLLCFFPARFIVSTRYISILWFPLQQKKKKMNVQTNVNADLMI